MWVKEGAEGVVMRMEVGVVPPQGVTERFVAGAIADNVLSGL